jgi:hypothetical protein
MTNPDPEFVEAIAAWALKDAARRNPVEAVERALADYGSPKIGTDEYVSVRQAAVVKSTTARLDASWPAEQPSAGSDSKVRGWLTYMDEAIDNEEDTRIIAAINAFLDERDRLVARVAELEAHPWLSVDPGGVLADEMREIQDRQTAVRVADLEAENERLQAERDDAHRRFDALVHADKAKQGAADWMLNRLHDDRLIDDGTYTLLCGLLRDQIDATKHLTHSEDWGPLTDRFRAAVKRTKDAEAEADQLRARFAELSDGMTVAVELLDRLANDEECELWPRGCQTHGGYPDPCPHPLARQVVVAWRAVQVEGVDGA